ncbi:peptidylprolyl isomerase [Chlorobium ferrooxidans]|uniref:peptidylprolyl isomerase n=1 Tax=Chlorobium ferrooxidans DSM 13031 TaxID=377431 RepID=Q0YQK5_9CHLB|nr:peptidylprolyl isomerase [Chlorobium ferrooxidans]EAT58612.1 PpiC-type peptidyl-prolyl cis-trans isomerase [Chlorobium ferrooxidans DSM 13031]
MKKISGKAVLLFLAGLASITTPSYAEVADRIVAVVGREVILKSEIDSRALMARLQSPELAKDTGLSRRILDGLIEQQIILSKAKIDSVKVDENAISATAGDRFKQLRARFASKEEMETRFGKTLPAIRDEIRTEIRNQELIQTLRRKRSAGVKVTSGEVMDYYNANREKFSLIPEGVKVSQIMKYPAVSADAQLQALTKIQAVRKELQGGADFALLARKYSQDPGSARLGGDLGYVQKGALIPSFETAAFSLKEGEVSGIIETRYGYHIIQLLNKEPNAIHVRHILVAFDHSKDDFSGVDQLLNSIRADILSGKSSFSEMASKYSDDPSTAKLGGVISSIGGVGEYISLPSLRPELRAIITALKNPGDISPPSKIDPPQGESFYTIIKLNERVAAHTVNPEKDYSFLEEEALDNKNRRLFSEWVQQLRKEVYVRTSDI